MPARYTWERRAALIVVLFAVAFAAGCMNKAAINDFAVQASTSLNNMQIHGDQPLLQAQRDVAYVYMDKLASLSADPPKKKADSGDERVRQAVSLMRMTVGLSSSDAKSLEDLGWVCTTTEPGIWPYHDVQDLITRGDPPLQNVLCRLQKGLISSIATEKNRAENHLKTAKESLAESRDYPAKEKEPSEDKLKTAKAQRIDIADNIAQRLAAQHAYLSGYYLPRLGALECTDQSNLAYMQAIQTRREAASYYAEFLQAQYCLLTGKNLSNPGVDYNDSLVWALQADLINLSSAAGQCSKKVDMSNDEIAWAYTNQINLYYLFVFWHYLPQSQQVAAIQNSLKQAKVEAISGKISNNKPAFDSCAKLTQPTPSQASECDKINKHYASLLSQMAIARRDQEIISSEAANRIAKLKSSVASDCIDALKNIYGELFNGQAKNLAKLCDQIRRWIQNHKIKARRATITKKYLLENAPSTEGINLQYALPDLQRLLFADLAVVQALMAQKRSASNGYYKLELEDIARAHKSLYEHRWELDDKELKFELERATSYLQRLDKCLQDDNCVPAGNANWSPDNGPGQDPTASDIPTMAPNMDLKIRK